MNIRTHVCRLPAALTHSVEKSMAYLHVLVYHPMSEVLQIVAQNVLSTRNVRVIWLVSTKNVEIHVRGLVGQELNARLSTIRLFVPA